MKLERKSADLADPANKFRPTCRRDFALAVGTLREQGLKPADIATALSLTVPGVLAICYEIDHAGESQFPTNTAQRRQLKEPTP